MSSSGKATGNGGSIEDSHTNIFALADLNGLKWRKYVYCNTTPESTTNNSIDVLGDNDCDNAPYVHEDDNFRSVSQNSHIGLKDGNSNKAHSYPITDGNTKFNSSLLSTKLLQNDALFISYSNLLSHNLLCVWRVKPGVSNYNTISEFAKQSRELWVFWHGDDPSFENFIHKDLQDFEIGSWDTGLSYECRTLLFKAFHNNIERYLLLRGFVRLDKWFVEPRLTFHQLYRKRYFDNILNRSSFPLKTTKSHGLYNNNNKQSGGNFKHMEQFMNTKSSSAYKLQLAFSFSFFLHGESAICASLQVQKFPCLARFPNLSSNIPALAPKMNVILAPCGISGILTGKYMKVPDTGVESFMREWHKFMPDKDYATIFFDCDNFSNNNCSNNNNNNINKDERHGKSNMSIGANVPDKFNKLAQLELAEILLANNYVTYYPTRHILLVDDPMDALLLDNSTDNFSLGSTLNLPCTTKTKDSTNMEKSKTIIVPSSLNHNNVNNINNINNSVNSNTNLTPPPSPAFMLHNIPPCKICGLIDTKCVCTTDSKSKSYQAYLTPAQGKRQHGEMGKITSTLLATSADETKFLGHATNMDLNAFECDETIAYYEGCMDCQLLNLCTKKGENKMNISLKFPNKTKFCHCNRKQKIPEYLRKLYICQSSINDGQNKNIISTFERLNYIIRKTSLSPNSAIKVARLKQKPPYRKLHYFMQRRRLNPSSYHKLLNTYDSTVELIHQNLEPPNILQNISNLHHKIGVAKTKSIDTGVVEYKIPKNNVIPISSSIVISSTEPKNYQVLAEKCNQTTNAFLSSDGNSYINVASKFTDKTKKKDDITIPQPQNVSMTLVDPNRKNFNTLYTNRYISFPRWFSINRIRLKRWLIHKRKQYLTQMKSRQLNEEQAHLVNNASNYNQNSIPNPQSHQERYLLNARGTGTQATSDYSPFVKSEPNFTSPLYQNGPSPHTIMMTSSNSNNETQIGPYYNRNNATSHSVITDNNNDMKSNINENGTGKTISTFSTVPPSFDPYEFDEFNEQHARQTNNGMPLMSNSSTNTRKIFNANNNNSKTSLQYGGKSDDSNTNIFQSLKSKDYDFSVTEKTTTSPSGQPLSANAPSLSKILNQPLNHPNPLMPKIPVVSVPLNPGIISNTDLSRIFPTPPSLESNNLYSPCSAPPPIGYVPPQITNNNTIIGSNAITYSIHGPDNICSYPPSINTSTVNFYGAGPTNFSIPNNFANAPHLYSNSGVVGMGSSVKNKPYSYHNPNQLQPLNEFPPPIVQYYSDGTPTLDSLLDRKPLVNPNSLKDTTNSLPDNSLYPGSGKNENLFNHIRTNCDATPPTQTNQFNYHDTKRFHNFPFANDNDVKTAINNSLHPKMPYHDGIKSTINARNQRFNPLSFDLSSSDLRSDTSTIKSPSGLDTSLLNLNSLANSLVQNQSNENWSIDTAVRDDMFNEIDLQHKEIDGLRNFSVKYARFKKLHSNSPNATNTNANITTTQLQTEKFEPNMVHSFSDIKKTSIVTTTKSHMNSSMIKYTNALYAVLYIESQSYAQMIDINYESSTICACNASIHQHSCNFISPTMYIGSDLVKTKSKYYPCHISPTSIYRYIEQLRNIFNLPNPIPTKLYKPNPTPVGTNIKDDHPENVSQLLNNYVNYLLKQDKFIHYVSASKSLKTLSCHNDNTKQSRPRPQNNPQYYHHKCICGFNSYTNQYLSYNNGLFWEDELAIVYATSPTDSQLNSAVPLSAIYGLIRNMMRFIISFIYANWSTNTSTNLVSNDKAITPFRVVSFEALSDYKRDETWTRFITKNDAGTINNTRSEKSTAVSPILSGDMLNYVMWFGGASCDPYNSLLSSFIAKEPTSSPSNTIFNLSCDNNFLASDKEATINWRAFMDRCATFESAFQFASSSTVYGDANINLFGNDNNDKANNNTCQILGLSLLFSAHVWPLMTVESATPDMKVCQHSVRYMRTILRDAIERRSNLMETLAGINNMASVAMVTHTNHPAVDESASSFGEDPFVKANNSKTACTTTFPGSAPGSNNIPNNPAQFFTSPHNNAMMYGNSHHSHSNKFEQSCIISGPLTWQQFHKLAGRGKEERCEPQPIPQIYINYENDKCVISPLSLSFWDYSHFDPYNMAKDIYYNVITLEEDDCIYMIKEYFTNLNASFETCRFGHHLPMNSGKTPTDYITTLNPQTINENLSSSYPTWITNLKCNSYLKALIQSYHTVFQQKIALIQDVYNKMMYPNKYKTKNIGDNNNNNNYSPSGPPSNSMLINSPKPPALTNNPNNCIPPPSTMQSGTAANLLNQHQKLLNNLYPQTTEVQKFCINQRTSFIIYIVDPCIGPYKNAECNTKTSFYHDTNISGQYDRQNQHGNDKFCKTESDTTENTIHVESPKLMQMYMCNILRAFDDVFLKSSLLPDTIKNRISLKFVPIQYITQSMSFKDRKLYDFLALSTYSGIMYQQPVITNIPFRSFTGFGPGINKNVMRTNNVKKLFATHNQKNSVPNTPNTINVGHKSNPIHAIVKYYAPPYVLALPFHDQWQMRKHLNVGNKSTSIPLAFNPILPNAGLAYQSSATPYMDHHHHHSNHKELGNKYGNTNANTLAGHKVSEEILFCSYCLSHDQTWLIATFTNERGALLTTSLINLHCSNRFKKKELTFIRSVLGKLYTFIIQNIIAKTNHSWRLVFTRVGRLGHGELIGWCELLNHKHLAKTNEQLIESCQVCNMFSSNPPKSSLKPNNKHHFPVDNNTQHISQATNATPYHEKCSNCPKIMSASLISLACNRHFRVFPESVAPELDRMGPSKYNPLHTPRDISVTHILVIPLSAYSQSNDTTGMDEFNSSANNMRRQGTRSHVGDYNKKTTTYHNNNNKSHMDQQLHNMETDQALDSFYGNSNNNHINLNPSLNDLNNSNFMNLNNGANGCPDDFDILAGVMGALDSIEAAEKEENNANRQQQFNSQNNDASHLQNTNNDNQQFFKNSGGFNSFSNNQSDPYGLNQNHIDGNMMSTNQSITTNNNNGGVNKSMEIEDDDLLLLKAFNDLPIDQFLMMDMDEVINEVTAGTVGLTNNNNNIKTNFNNNTSDDINAFNEPSNNNVIGANNMLYNNINANYMGNEARSDMDRSLPTNYFGNETYQQNLNQTHIPTQQNAAYQQFDNHGVQNKLKENLNTGNEEIYLQYNNPAKHAIQSAKEYDNLMAGNRALSLTRVDNTFAANIPTTCADILVSILQQQPLALGYYISTAPFNHYVPDWFAQDWDQTLTSFMNASLHLNITLQTGNPLAQNFLETVMFSSSEKDKTHPLDSTQTTIILRFILDSFNQLSWLIIDPFKRDRHSSLPIHIQILFNIYQILMTFSNNGDSNT